MPAESRPPATLTSGDSASWSVLLAQYPPADGWVLKYALQGPTQQVLTASTDGDGYLVEVSPAVSAAFAPGRYVWTAFVAKTNARHTLDRGELLILANPAATAPETYAQRTLALIRAAIEGRIPNGLEKTTIDGQELERIGILDLQKLEAIYAARVAQEQNAARVALGFKSRRNILARFTR